MKIDRQHISCRDEQTKSKRPRVSLSSIYELRVASFYPSSYITSDIDVSHSIHSARSTEPFYNLLEKTRPFPNLYANVSQPVVSSISSGSRSGGRHSCGGTHDAITLRHFATNLDGTGLSRAMVSTRRGRTDLQVREKDDTGKMRT